jgi:hypothetical protein
VLQGVWIAETVAVRCESARACARSPGTRPIHQACHALVGKALPPWAEGRMGTMAGRGDPLERVPSDHRMAGLGTAKDTRLLGLLAHGCSGRERMVRQGAFEGAHRLAPWGA